MMIIFFLSSIVAANVAVSELAPVTVWPGVYAPAGVYLVALTLVLRDLVQRYHGVRGLLVAGTGGVALSFLLADSAVVWASVAAFVVSFLFDTAIYHAVVGIAGRPLWVGMLVSGLASLVPDTLVFLYLANLEQFIPGQLIGKLWGVLGAVLVFAMTPGLDRQKVPSSLENDSPADCSCDVRGCVWGHGA